MAASDGGSINLFVKKLPSELTNQDKEDFLKYFGAQDVICMDRKSRLRDAAFATFPDDKSASKALSRLHQMEVLGNRLVVEYASSHHEKLVSKVCQRTSYKKHSMPEESGQSPEKEPSDVTNKKLEKSESVNMEQKAVGGMNPKLGIHYQPSRSLHYLYPPPSPEVLTNILNTLVCVPKLYVQVLHLMNKMNLPCPFGTVLPAPPPIDAQGGMVRQADGPDEDSDKFLSSEESELESDEEERQRRAQEKASIAKRKNLSKSESKQHKRTRLHISSSLPKKMKLAESTPVPVERVFDQAIGQQAKKIEFKLSNDVSTIFDTGPSHTSTFHAPTPMGDGFGTFAPPDLPVAIEDDAKSEDEYSADDDDDDGDVISLEQLKRNQMPERERSSLPAFKNYSPGEISCRLYVKNLAKQVEEEDLHYIFRRYVRKDSTAEKNSFDIRLMKEGRMKGQAFISLPSERRAKRALREVHGYILYGKPMVIQFSRSNKAKD